MGKRNVRLSGGDLGIYTTERTSNQLYMESFRDDLIIEKQSKLIFGKSKVKDWLFIFQNSKKKTNDFIRSIFTRSSRWPEEKRDSVKDSIYRMDFCRNTIKLDYNNIMTFDPAFVMDRDVLLLKDLDKDYITYLYGSDDILKITTVPRGHLGKEEYQITVKNIAEDTILQERNYKLYTILSVFTYTEVLKIASFFLNFEKWKKSSPTILEYVKKDSI